MEPFANIVNGLQNLHLRCLTGLSRSPWHKQNIVKCFRVVEIRYFFVIFLECFLLPPDRVALWFRMYEKYKLEKNLTIFKGCHFPRIYSLIWSNLRKIETKNFHSDTCIFSLVKLRTISPTAYFLNSVNIRRSLTIAAIIQGLSMFQRLVRLTEGFNLLTQGEAIQRCSEKQVLKTIL